MSNLITATLAGLISLISGRWLKYEIPIALILLLFNWLRRNLASRLVWHENGYTVKAKNVVRLNGIIEYSDNDLNLQLDYEWYEGVYYITVPGVLYSTHDPAHNLTGQEKDRALERVDHALNELKLAHNYDGPPGVIVRQID